MDIFLLVLGIVLQLVGIAGCVLPIIPGPIISYLGLLALHFSRYADYSPAFLIIFAAVAIGVQIIDTVVPIWGTKKYGGSKAGIWGATIGLVIGIFFFPPFGIIVGPFIGAVAVELLKGRSERDSLRAGWGAVVGFLLGTGIKLIASFVMAYYFTASIL